MSKKRLYEIIYEVSRTVNSSLDPSEVLSRIAEQVTRAMGVKGCFIRLLDRSGKVLKPAAYYGLSERYAKKGVVEKWPRAAWTAKLSPARWSRSPMRVRTRASSTAAKRQRKGWFPCWWPPCSWKAAVPSACSRVYTGERREFDEEEIGFLQAIANISAIAIENARMHQTLKRQMELINAYDYQVFED